MKTMFIKVAAITVLLFNSMYSFAGLEWNKGILTNPDNVYRYANSVAYSTDGSIYVAGIEESTSGSRLIVTKKYSSNGALLASVTNIVFVPVGTVISDVVRSISVDNSGNVYVLGSQYVSNARGEDVVLIKYNSSLSLQWKKLIYNPDYPSNNNNDVASKMLFDAAGNVYVIGNWYNATHADKNQIFVRKFNSAGTVLYTSKVSESSNVEIYGASGVCIDNSSNITIVASVKYFGSFRVVYSRISSAGTFQWTKYYDPPSGYTLTSSSAIVCTGAGEFYISASLSIPSPVITYEYRGRLTYSKFSSTGTKLWNRYTTEGDYYPREATMQIDAGNNIYIGGTFAGPSGSGADNYRIYKYNSAGTLLWSHLSTEAHTQYLKLETYSTTALFAVFLDNGAGYPKLKKFNASNGIPIWTESITVVEPPGYVFSQVTYSDISVNKNTSEVAYCGIVQGSTGSPGFDEERRWNVRKYGATSPRYAGELSEETISDNPVKVSLYPNPAQEQLQIRYDGDVTPANIFIYDVEGRLLTKITNNTKYSLTVPVLDFPNGIIFIHSEFHNRKVISKAMVAK